MAEDERRLIDAERSAIEEINRSGGLLGRKVQWVIADGGSDATTYARRAERLIREDNADVIVGGGPDGFRRSLVPFVEQAGHLLLFPRPHEGFEESPAVVSLGPLPNQVVGPALAWCRESLSAGSFFLVKGDDTWSRSAAAVAADQLTLSGARIVGDVEFGRSGGDAVTVAAAVHAARPDVVCCLLSREPCGTLLRRLREAGLNAADSAILLVALDDDDIVAMPREDVSGTYVVAPSLRVVGAAASRSPAVVETDSRVRARDSGMASDREIPARILTARESIRMWAAAVRACGSADVAVVRAAIRRQTLDTVEGVVAVDASSGHAWRNVVVGRVRADGMVDHVWSSASPLRPAPFPATRSRSEWMRFLVSMEKGLAQRTDGGGGLTPLASPNDQPAGIPR